MIAILIVTSLTTRVSAQDQPLLPTGTPFSTVTPDLAASDFGPVAAQSPYRIALLVPFPDDPFWQAVERTVTQRAAADGVTVDIYALTTPSVPEQTAQMNEVIAQGYQGILLGPVDAVGSVPAIAAANTAGIPVLAIDVAPGGGEVISVVQTDDQAAAMVAARYIGQEIDGVGAVLDLQGDLANPVAQERTRGLQDGFASFPAITTIPEQANWDRDQAFVLTRGRLPDAGTPLGTSSTALSAVFAANDRMALGAADAVDDAQTDEVIVVGFGLTADTRIALEQGLLTAVIAELPTRIGAIAVDVMTHHLNGDSVLAAIDSGVAIVTRDTVDQMPP
jgi:ribose transport system substrate-binding protein